MTEQSYRFGRDSDAHRTFLITRQEPVRPRSLSSDLRRLALVAMIIARSTARMIGKLMSVIGADIAGAPKRYCPERHYMRGPGPMTHARKAR